MNITHPAWENGLYPVPLGLYRIHWKSGGSSLAAIGMNHDGSRWIAPTNWTSPTTTMIDGDGDSIWQSIDRFEMIPYLSDDRAVTQKIARYGGMVYAFDEVIEYLDTINLSNIATLFENRKSGFVKMIEHLKEKLNGCQ